MRLIVILAALIFGVTSTLAQQVPQQAGPWTAGHLPIYSSSGTFTPIIQDGGTAGGIPSGVNPSEIGITARGTGTPPYANAGSGPDGELFCTWDGPTNAVAGAHYLCITPNNGSGGSINYGAVGAASALPLFITVNGVEVEFPFTTGGIIGPGSSTVGNLVCWDNTSGTLVDDCGPRTTTPGTTTVGDVACWGNVSGTDLDDCGPYVDTPGVTVNGDVVCWGNTTGTIQTDCGPRLSTPGTTVTNDFVCWANTTGTSINDCVTRLTANTTVFVDGTLGSDVAGCGKTSGASACATFNFMDSQIRRSYFLSGYKITMQAADGTYAPWSPSGPWPGGGVVMLQGDTGAIGDVIIDGNGAASCLLAMNQARVEVQYVRVTDCAIGVGASIAASIGFNHIDFDTDTVSSISVYCTRMGYCEMNGSGNLLSSVGVNGNFIQVSHQGNFRASAGSTTATAVTLTDNITVGEFAYATSLGDITWTGYSSSAIALGGFTVTGFRWQAESGGHFQVLSAATGEGLTIAFFPGSAAGFCVGVCEVDQSGHKAPTVGSCGTSPVIVGTDYAGKVTEGSTSITSCVITFDSNFAQAPYCQVTPGTLVSATPLIVATSTSTLGVSHAASAASGTFFYQCTGF